MISMNPYPPQTKFVLANLSEGNGQLKDIRQLNFSFSLTRSPFYIANHVYFMSRSLQIRLNITYTKKF